MRTFDIIVIGFGKAGKTFAKTAAKLGKKVALIERSKEMYGGTCINIACIPTKVLVEAGREGIGFSAAMERKREVVAALNNKNFHNLHDDANITVIDGMSRFKENKVIEVLEHGMVTDTLTAEIVIINTGAMANVPEIAGLKESKHVYDSTSIMYLEKAPKRLVIIGGGYIALEFASMMTNFGSKVTILERSDRLMPREDEEIVSEVVSDFGKRGIEIIFHASTESVIDVDGGALLKTNQGEFEADAI